MLSKQMSSLPDGVGHLPRAFSEDFGCLDFLGHEFLEIGNWYQQRKKSQRRFVRSRVGRVPTYSIPWEVVKPGIPLTLKNLKNVLFEEFVILRSGSKEV